MSRFIDDATYQHLIQFTRESYQIEGERLNSMKPIEAAKTFLENKITKKSLLDLHGSLSDESWAGKYRQVMVTVGNHVPPGVEMVPHLMGNLILDIDTMDSWEAHNRFENIHPFQDLNGRIGRYIWLHKALGEGYRFEIPFLHKYYYQTLAHQQ